MARVLVVDDEEDVRNLVAFNLKAAGMEVLQAKNGVEALEMVKNESPDLVVLDLMMPEMDGISVCEMIRKLPRASETPVVMLTAWATDRARVVGLQAGASDYITKPFSPRELVKRVQGLLTEHRLRASHCKKMELRQLSIDLEQMEVKANGHQVDLSTEEFRMLTLLVEAIFRRMDDKTNHS
jgi:DNA-binding response OmpR family regulator